MELFNVNIFDADGKCIDSMDYPAKDWQEAEKEVTAHYCRNGEYCLAS